MPSIIEDSKSAELYQQATQYLVGGVNSPVRAFKSVGGSPIFIQSATGSTINDVDGNSYIDYVGSWGPMILGHRHPKVIQAILEQASLGTSYGAPHALELKLASLIAHKIPSIERVRMTSSGTEATMSAVRLARAYTKRDKIIKFSGCYHGHADVFLVDAGSGALSLGQPSSPGIPHDVSKHTLIAQYNNILDVEKLFAAYPQQIAAIIVEPIAANMNVILPQPGFLQALRDICTLHRSLLIFDEVITGFRVHPAGAQGLYGVMPDMCTLGKIIGGGLPAAAFGGAKNIMALLAPEGPVYQAGTLSGNPMAMAAGIATLEQLTPQCYSELAQKSQYFCKALQAAAEKYEFPMQLIHVDSLIGLQFHSLAGDIDTTLYARFFHHMLAKGHYFAPSAYEAVFISTAHTMTQLEHTISDVTDFMRNNC
jgi:glutamate-1-semialdehyde 2,1-aminomutase